MLSRRFYFAAMLVISLAASLYGQPPRWKTLPHTPAPVLGMKRGYAEVNDIRLYYATSLAADHSTGVPVVLLHGGLANSDYWGNQVRALHAHHNVILVDSRGHGRSTRNASGYHYDLMADDVVALLDKLHVAKADIVGWSDGAIVGLDLAMSHPQRIRRVFAFAANVTTDGVIADSDKNPTFAAFIQRAGQEYRTLSATPEEYPVFVNQITHMWLTEPEWTADQLASIRVPVLIADGDHDEAIVKGHAEKIAAAIPGSSLLILPGTSHFAFLQDPALFNAALLDFLDQH